MERDLEKSASKYIDAAAPAGEDDITIAPEKKVVGTVQLLVHNETVLIPTPSPDPKGLFQSCRFLLPLTLLRRSPQSPYLAEMGNSYSTRRL